MDWSNEPYVRLYTRTTPTWRRLRWEGQCLFMYLLRNVDRAGVLDGIIDPIDDLVAMTNMPFEVVETGYELLIKYKVIQFGNDTILIPNFLEAQEASKSDKQRQAECRQRKRDKAKHETSQSVISESQSDAHESRTVTGGHTESQPVTLTCALPSLPNLTSTNIDALFEKFWDNWPKGKKKGRGDAEKSFEKALKRSSWDSFMTYEQRTEIMIGAVKKHETSEDWTKNNRAYIPNPSTWLNQARWLDELNYEKEHKPAAKPNAFLAACEREENEKRN